MREIPWLREYSTAWWKPCAPLFLFGLLGTLGVLLLAGNAQLLQISLTAVQLIAACWAVFCCLQAARRAQRWNSEMRAPWLMLAVSMACFAAGAVSNLLLSLLGVARTFPSIIDFFWGVHQTLLWVALLRLAWLHRTESGQALTSLRVIADAMIVALSVFILYWTVLINPGLALPLSTPGRALWIYYPLTGILSLFAVVLLAFAARRQVRLTRVSGMLLLGVGCFLLVNAAHFSRVLQARAAPLEGSSPLEIGWMWACLTIAAAALLHGEIPLTLGRGDSAAGENDRPNFVVAWLPYIAGLLVSLGLIGYEIRVGHAAAVRALLPALLLLFAVVARQMLTLSDNLRLSARLQNANLSLEVVNSDLEKNVQERTQHLSTLHGITSTLNTTLDRRTVLRVALERTISATNADGGGIWLRVAEDEQAPDPQASDESAPTFWELAYSHGFGDNMVLENMLRDLAVAAAEEQGNPISMLPSTRLALQYGFAPSPHNIVLVPIRWGGTLLGTFGLLRHSGSFTYDDRALVESVALEAGTALQNARLYQEARHRADRDSVTGLLNHRAVQERLNAELNKARRGNIELSVVMMDLNNFKFFNDTYGHPVGDEVLRTVARHLREVCRENDIVGRYGGDEFIALLPQTDSAGAQEFCRRFETRLGEQHFQADSGSRIPIEMAFGWSLFPRDADSALELLTIADSNLYEYKHSGGLDRAATALKASEQGRIEVRKLKNRAAGGSFGVLDALVTAIDNKDHYTRRHSEEVTHYSLLVAKEMGYSEEALRAVRISGLLHDVGKIAVPDEILRHPGQLGQNEWEIMRQHPSFGALIVKDLPHLDEVLDGVRYHHERWDGKGYPDGLREEEIPMMGRLLAVGDCFSAMTTNRPYRKAFAPEDALREIERGIGVQFDPLIATTFISIMRRELAAQEQGGQKIEAPDLSDELREEFALLPSVASR